MLGSLCRLIRYERLDSLRDQCIPVRFQTKVVCDRYALVCDLLTIQNSTGSKIRLWLLSFNKNDCKRSVRSVPNKHTLWSCSDTKNYRQGAHEPIYRIHERANAVKPDRYYLVG